MAILFFAWGREDERTLGLVCRSVGGVRQGPAERVPHSLRLERHRPLCHHHPDCDQLCPGTLWPGEDLLAALLWVVLFFAAMAGLSRVFVHEEESKTAPALRLAAPASAVYLGKYLFNLVLLLLLEVLIVPLFIVMMGLQVGNFGLFALVLLLGNLGLAGATTIIAAMVSQASARGALFTVLSFPLLLPLLISTIEGTRLTLAQAELASPWPSFQVLLAYAVAMVTVSLMLFPAIWTE